MLYTLAGGGTLCGVAALVLLIVSTATDFWMQYRYSGSSANQGLWRFCIMRKCHAHTITVAFWDATRAFMLLSILSCFIGVLLGLSAFANGTSRRVRAGGIALIMSGFLALLALAIYTGVTVNFFGKRYLDWRFSWSYILAWVGIILAFAAGVFQMCAYQKNFSAPPAPNDTES
ncbi:lens fiber membrane intrinsic protein-like [Megalops cyprinoides]|uniref:lens fiber membrane intrinsic protein-like n=1 Tax=Megalops cyprinoides TaxID=118141 RepID=UPI001864698A|nr:lens fiber membrane intrinsic protein-like [Megalops cyprinoides]